MMNLRKFYRKKKRLDLVWKWFVKLLKQIAPLYGIPTEVYLNYIRDLEERCLEDDDEQDTSN